MNSVSVRRGAVDVKKQLILKHYCRILPHEYFRYKGLVVEDVQFIPEYKTRRASSYVCGGKKTKHLLSRVKTAYQFSNSSAGLRNKYVSNVVSVFGPRGRGFCYLKFSSVFVEDLARKMPFGVSLDFPVYLEIRYCPVVHKWKMYGVYLKSDVHRLLGVFDTFPEWLGNVRWS